MIIYCYTFNQNGNYIEANNLEHLFENSQYDGKRPDIICAAFQETRYGFEYYWDDTNIKSNYEVIHKIRLNGIGNVGIRGLGLYILKHREFPKKVEFIEENWVRFNHQYFGKGAVAIKIKIDGSLFLFINTHMPYSESWEGGGIKERVDSMNTIFTDIVTKTRYDYLFMMGDFNFRIHLKTKNKYASMITEDDPKLFEMYIKNRSWKLLYFNDELYLLNYFYSNYLKELTEGKNYAAEYGYQLEIPLLPFFRQLIDTFQFPPTYKVYRGRKEIQDPLESTLNIDKFYERWDTDRIPSWCDRVLFYKNDNIERLTYNSGDSRLINNSDHLPVWSHFKVSD